MKCWKNLTDDYYYCVQVLKTCLNHRIQPGMMLTPLATGQGKVYTWHANDYAEGTLSHELFAIRFKTPELASKFKVIFEAVHSDSEEGDASGLLRRLLLEDKDLTGKPGLEISDNPVAYVYQPLLAASKIFLSIF